VTAFIGNFCFFPALFLLIFFTKKPGGGFAFPGLKIGAAFAGWRCASPA